MANRKKAGKKNSYSSICQDYKMRIFIPGRQNEIREIRNPYLTTRIERMNRLIMFCIGILFACIATGVVNGEEVSDAPETMPEVTGDLYSGSIDLTSGWNFVSVTRRLADSSNTATIFRGIDSAGHSIWTFNQNNGGWNDLTEDEKILPLEGYWVYTTSPVSVPLRFSDDPLQVPPVKDMISGWNMFGFTGSTPASARDSLLSIRNFWTEVIGFDPAMQQFEVTIINGGSNEQVDSRMLLPNHAYWVYVTESCSLASIGA